MDYLVWAWEKLTKDLEEFTVQVERLQKKLIDEANPRNRKELNLVLNYPDQLSELKKSETLLSGINNVD